MAPTLAAMAIAILIHAIFNYSFPQADLAGIAGIQ
ncbi:hypothetical protein FHS49_000513 [Sphingobium boeckii]|uniref:Uncharacterized protein n=1 Tax=Sphingobium boeckii TaxID=1082345 RepID=A0A7W9AFD2_9SPHN|nr:hypothetical protein [Sphingobium boeckii]